MGFITNIRNFRQAYQDIKEAKSTTANIIKKDSTTGKLPKGRVSKPDLSQNITWLQGEAALVSPSYNQELIPLIRKLFVINENVSLAVSDLVQLTNTGHTLKFDASVKPEQAAKMREHIKLKAKTWVMGAAGIHGIINKMVMQLFISGAVSIEYIPNNKLDGIATMAFVNPENVVFSYGAGKWEAWQKLTNTILPKDGITKVKLNPLTYKYYGLFNDQEVPYGIPPFIAALDDIATHKDVIKNIAFIVDQLGLMGFTELLLKKPNQEHQESETKYAKRLSNLLEEAKENMKGGVKEGIMVGYEEDHEYNFQSVTKNISGLPEIYDILHRLVASGLKYSSDFMGVASKSETQIAIVFTKMLSQLNNIQMHVKETLEYGLSLELLLAGYNFKYITVEFKASTITDEVKIEQAREYRIRNDRVLYADGIQTHQQYAENQGFDKPAHKGPIVPIDPDGTLQKAEDSRKREADKDKSDRKTRDKQKPVPKSKPADSKER